MSLFACNAFVISQSVLDSGAGSCKSALWRDGSGHVALGSRRMLRNAGDERIQGSSLREPNCHRSSTTWSVVEIVGMMLVRSRSRLLLMR